MEYRARMLRLSSSWHDRLDTKLWPDRKPAVFIGPIAAGEAVVADNAGRIATLLYQHYGDTLAIEMEGRGFLEAAHINSGCRAVVVRGVSDLLAGKSETDAQNWQQRAADAAAAFMFEMLAMDDPPGKEDRPTASHDNAEFPGSAPIQAMESQHQVVRQTIPPPPERNFGREELVDRLASEMSETRGLKVAVLGGPGFGKTTLTTALLNHPTAAQVFGARRWFAELETATNSVAMRAAIANQCVSAETPRSTRCWRI